MAADIDVRTIAAFSSLSEATINNIVESPTQDLVLSLLAAIENKAKEYNQLKPQKVKLEVELETYVRSSESKIKVIQNSRDKALAEVSKLRLDVQNADIARVKVESELEQLRQSHSSDASEVKNLKSRITSLEAANRDSLALVDSKSSTCDSLSQDLSAQHQKIVELRKQVSALEQANQAAASSVASAKFREQGLQQELDLQKKNNDWLENERKIKAEEHATFRKEKNARVSELVRSNEGYIDEIETLRRSEAGLRSRLEDQINKVEDLLQEIEKLREKELTDADSHRIELDSVNRLAQLQEASANTAKQRVNELSAALEEVRDEAADEIGRIRAEIETEHQDREAAEQRVAELEARVTELEAEVDQARVQPATPRREINGSALFTPARPGTPSGIFSPALGGRLKGANHNLTVSQLYGEYKALEKELAQERRLSAELQTNLDSMLEDLESKRPEIEELREDQTRLQSEVFEMSTLMEKANHERADAVKEARILQGQVEAVSKELEDCKQTLRDRNSQLRWLIMDREAREQGQSLTEEGFAQLQQAALNADIRDAEHLSETQKLVNQNLVLFKSVAEMQQQNENQLITIRRLVEQLETAEARQTRQENQNLKSELEIAHNRMVEYQTEIKHMVAQSKSFIKERDMFKNMLTRRGHNAGLVDPNDFSRSLPLPAGGYPARSMDDGAITSTASDYAKLLKDMQAHFDSFRQETTTNTETLRSQNNDLMQRNAKLQTDASRAVGQLTAATQRYDMLKANYDMLKVENGEILKRSNLATENAAKQEIKVQQAAEELIEARGVLDSLRRESANLKAEKDLWKNVEQRLIEDNESLRNERGRLDQLNGSLQHILNEREQTDSETRRRLQLQVESLEKELDSAKRKLNEELEDNKKASQRREYDHDQSQKRIDDLIASLSSTREELASTKSTRDHLQARVDELTVELRSAEERLEVLNRPNQPSDQTNGAEEPTISREQELSVEVSELKRDLDLRAAELERVNEQIEVYKGIAQSAEERLQELIDTNDQYREETESVLTEKDGKIKDLEQRIEDISAELNTTNSELTTLRDEHSESNRKLDEQKTFFEAEIVRLKDSEEKSAEQARFNLEATKAQAQIATEAQQNYENELLKHAEAAKNLHTIRDESNRLRLELTEFKTQVENTRHDLEQKEASWSELKDRYEREITDLKKRRDEVAQQNSHLHTQMESLTQQITTIQRDRAALVDAESSEPVDGGVKGLGDLQEVVKYLRREKEIVDVQYHLSTQEAKRLRQQLDFTKDQLEQTRLKLNQQQRLEAESEQNKMNHKQLMDTIEELSLFRESSVTLRAEAKQATQALAEKSKLVNELEGQIQALQARIAEVENLSELREGEMKLLQDDRDHWRQRCQNILSKYDRVDPAELESLKTRLNELEQERDQAAASQTNLQEQIDAHPAQVEAAKADLKARLAEQFKTQVRALNVRIRDKQTEVDEVTNSMAAVQTELDTLKQEFDTVKVQLSTASTEGQSKSAETAADSGELAARITELEAAIAAKDQELASAALQSDEKFKAREAQLKEVLNKRLGEFKHQANTAKDTAVEELRQKLIADHQKEIEELRAQSIPVTPSLQQADQLPPAAPTETTSTPSVASFDQLIESITDEQAKQLVSQNKTVRGILQRNIQKGRAEMKEALRQEITAESGTTATDTGSAGDDASKQAFDKEKEAIIQQKEQEFAAEKEAMIKEFSEKLEAERQAINMQKNQEFSIEKLEFSKESERKIADQVANAQMLAEKKGALKLNMATKKADLFNLKLDFVKKAAEETPEKPVKEVWDVAKDLKLALPPQQSKPSIPTAALQQASEATSATAADTTAATSNIQTNGTTEPEAASSEAKAEQEPDNNSKAPPRIDTSKANAGQNPPRSVIPQLRGSFRGRGGTATTPGHQAQQQSQSGQATRGTGIPRGGRGAGRGSIPRGGGATGPSPTSARGGGNAANSPSRPASALSATAQQFVPGAKRAREESDGNPGDGAGKRIRGSGSVGSATG